MRILIVFLIFLFAVVLQITILPAFLVFGVYPNLLLALIIILAFGDFKKPNFFLVFITGFTLDIISGLPFGVYLISFCVVYWFIWYLAKAFFRTGDWFGQAVVVICSCVIYSFLNLILIVIFNLMGLSAQIFDWQKRISVIFFEIAVNIVFALLVIFVLKKINGLFAGRELQIKKI